MTRSETDAQLAELYDQVPRIPDCDGRCWTSCGPVEMSDRERQRIRAAGFRITPYKQALTSIDRFWCDALTSDKTCAVYDRRPLICRLWGAVESMPCVYGCQPEGGYLTDMDAYRLIAESMRIGGGEHQGTAAQAEAALSQPGVREALERIQARGQAGEQNRAGEHVPAAFRRHNVKGN